MSLTSDRWQVKPPPGTGIDWTSHLSRKLLFCAPFSEGSGPAAYDQVAGGVMVLHNGAKWITGDSPQFGSGVLCSGVASGVTAGPSIAGSYLPIPTIYGPFSCISGLRLYSGNGQYASMGAIVAAATSTATTYLGGNQGATAGVINDRFGAMAVNAPLGVDFVYGHTMTGGTSSSGVESAYINGVQVYNQTGLNAALSYTSPYLNFGFCPADTGHTANMVGYWSMIWGRVLSPAEMAALATNPWRVLRPRRVMVSAYQSYKPGFVIFPASLYPHTNNVTLTLGGTATGWSSGTTNFTLSGVSGVTLVSQTVNSATTATLIIDTTSAGGTLAISDGTYSATATVLSATFAATPSPIPAGHVGHLTLTLSGSGTAWSGGTTFTLSGVSGVALVGQSVTSATSATLTITTGTGTGTLTISDGSESATVAVGTPALAVSPTWVAATTPYTISFAGSNTAWSQETASTLFSVSGVSGTSLSSTTVTSNTAATATLSLPSSSGGTLTVTDNSTGRTATMTVAAVGVGSLHVTGPVSVGPSSPTSELFGAKTAASIAFRFKANSAAGLNLSSGISLITWGNGASQLAAYFPATGLFSFAAYGQVGTSLQEFSGSVPIQLGVGYHFALTWSVGAPTSIGTGTLTNGSPSVTGLSRTVGLVVGSAISGTGIPANTTIQSINGTTSITISNNATATGSESLSVTTGVQTFYVDGVPYATGAIPFPTYAYEQVEIGGNAGTIADAPVATDFEVSDLAIWSAHALSSAEAAGLSSGTMNPLTVSGGTAATAWWPLGGGTVGSTPTIADSWFTDYTGNNNALAVLSGALSGGALYAAPITTGSPSIVAPLVAKCGKMAVFGATSSAPAANGAYPIAPVIAVNSNPTIYRNGTPIQIGPPVWFNASQNLPLVTYLLQCGSVEGVAITNGGSGYTSPSATFSAAPAGGTTAVAGTPVTETGLTGYTIKNGGSGFASGPVVAIQDASGTGSDAAAYSVVSGGYVTKVVVTSGGSGYTSPIVGIAAGYGESLSRDARRWRHHGHHREQRRLGIPQE